MPIKIIRDDITKIECDAIVNAASSTLLGGGGVDGAIHKAAGKGLFLECMKLDGCKVGQAKLTKAYKLPSKFVIHTVGPKWKGGQNGEKELLTSCYSESLRIAAENNCESIAFPLISSGTYGYPKAQVLKVAVDTYFTFISSRSDLCEESVALEETQILSSEPAELPALNYRMAAVPMEASLDELVSQIDESFSQMLLRKIDEKSMSDAECYKKANVDRKLFSKIRSDIHYHPKKTTAIAFAIALDLK